LRLRQGPPALALGIEPTAKDAMDKPPSEYQSMFTLHWFIDLYVLYHLLCRARWLIARAHGVYRFFYGVVIGALAIVNFVIVVYGKNFVRLELLTPSETSTAFGLRLTGDI
jgi:Na+-exporting ATPase